MENGKWKKTNVLCTKKKPLTLVMYDFILVDWETLYSRFLIINYYYRCTKN